MFSTTYSTYSEEEFSTADFSQNFSIQEGEMAREAAKKEKVSR